MNQDYKKASSLLRLLAFLIDSVLLLIPLILVDTILIYLRLNYFFINLIIPINFLIVAFYNTIFVARTGATIGKKLLRIKVVNQGYGNVSLVQTIIREFLGKFISSIIFLLGFAWILHDKNKQALHDKLAKSYVVKLETNGNIAISTNQKTNIIEQILFFVISIPLSLLFIFFVIYVTIGIPVKAPNNMMEPTYKAGAYVLVKPPILLKRPDVVFYNTVIDGNFRQFMQRIIAGPGDSILLKNNEIYINGIKLNQSRVIAPTVKTKPGSVLQEGRAITLYPGFYFVMGDNREASLDSREMGPVPRSAITGKVWICILNCGK